MQGRRRLGRVAPEHVPPLTTIPRVGEDRRSAGPERLRAGPRPLPLSSAAHAAIATPARAGVTVQWPGRPRQHLLRVPTLRALSASSRPFNRLASPVYLLARAAARAPPAGDAQAAWTRRTSHPSRPSRGRGPCAWGGRMNRIATLADLQAGKADLPRTSPARAPPRPPQSLPGRSSD